MQHLGKPRWSASDRPTVRRWLVGIVCVYSVVFLATAGFVTMRIASERGAWSAVAAPSSSVR